MKFVIDSAIPFADRMFQDLGEVTLLAGDRITSDRVRDADVLLVRSVTRVDRGLLLGSSVKFVGTATIGYDHLDTAYLRSCGIGYASAPGSNANSVAEYVIAAILEVANRLGLKLDRMTLGVVGVGHIGGKVVAKAAALGMKVLQNDPPLAGITGGKQFLPLDELMDADIITLHVPLTRTNPDATYHLFDKKQIERMKSGAVLINTARGAVVETSALKKALRSKHLGFAVLDVWENEPDIDTELLSLVRLGTPHIAGYSIDGKVNGSIMMYDAVCEHFGLQKTWSVDGLLPMPAVPEIVIDPLSPSHQEILSSIVRQCYSIEQDDQRMRTILSLSPVDRPRRFTELRDTYPDRREFSAVKVKLTRNDVHLSEVLLALGFQVEESTK